MPDTITLIPINATDQELVGIMTRPTSPRWMRLSACLALEHRKLVLVKDGFEIADICPNCRSAEAVIRAFHKNAFGGDPRCIIECHSCGHVTENRPLISLEKNQEQALKGFREAF